jgi:hypothetical protein
VKSRFKYHSDPIHSFLRLYVIPQSLLIVSFPPSRDEEDRGVLMVRLANTVKDSAARTIGWEHESCGFCEYFALRISLYLCELRNKGRKGRSNAPNGYKKLLI